MFVFSNCWTRVLLYARPADHRSADWNDAIMHSKKKSTIRDFSLFLADVQQLGYFSPRSCLTDIEDFYVATSICWLGTGFKYFFFLRESRSRNEAGYLEVKEGSYTGIINMINRCQRPVGRYPFGDFSSTATTGFPSFFLHIQNPAASKHQWRVFPLTWPTK